MCLSSSAWPKMSGCWATKTLWVFWLTISWDGFRPETFCFWGGVCSSALYVRMCPRYLFSTYVAMSPFQQQFLFVSSLLSPNVLSFMLLPDKPAYPFLCDPFQGYGWTELFLWRSCGWPLERTRCASRKRNGGTTRHGPTGRPSIFNLNNRISELVDVHNLFWVRSFCAGC